jgi:hypothetical protein
MPKINSLKLNNNSVSIKKRNVTFTFGENKALELLLNELEMIFPSMSKTEITQLAMIELRNSTIAKLGLKVELENYKVIREINKIEFAESTINITSDKELKNYLDQITKDL